LKMVCIAGKFTGGNPELAINAIYFLSKLFVILSAAFRQRAVSIAVCYIISRLA